MNNYTIENFKKWLNDNGLKSNYNNLMEFKDKITKEEEHHDEVITLYDELLQKQEKRGVSYGEIAYIQNLDSKELKALYDEITKELYDE